MKSSKPGTLRELSKSELENKLKEARENLFKLQLRKETRQMDDLVSVRVVRRVGWCEAHQVLQCHHNGTVGVDVRRGKAAIWLTCHGMGLPPMFLRFQRFCAYILTHEALCQAPRVAVYSPRVRMCCSSRASDH